MDNCEKCVQFSVFLVNKPGVLSQLFRELAKAKVNVLNVAMMDSMEHGVLRMVVSDPAGTRKVLKGLNISVTETDVLVITLPNRPGAVADMLEKLADSHINVGYMYCTNSARGGKTQVVVKVPDIRKTTKALENSKPSRRDMRVKLRRPTAGKKR